MRPHVTVRPEDPESATPIRDLIRAAFAGMPYAEGNEAELVDALRARQALSVSLVAEHAGTILGHVAFSPARASDGA